MTLLRIVLAFLSIWGVSGCNNYGYIGYRPNDTGGAAPSDRPVDTDSSVSSDHTDDTDDTSRRSDAGVDDSEETSTPTTLELTGDLEVLDPSMIRAEDQYLIFHTGEGIPIKRSSDMREWHAAGTVFEAMPDWVVERFGDIQEIWAPDISYSNGTYYLYYSVSAVFGENNSCIAVATATDPLQGPWTDHGPVVCSTASDMWNAIDPNFIRDESGTPWLVFGSYWSGIKMMALSTQGTATEGSLLSISSRGSLVATAAPFIIRRNEYYYHFVSFGQCCAGLESTHNIRVGRSEHITGPYIDKDGVEMMSGGGSPIMPADDERWKGPGHNAVFEDNGQFYNVYHAYDAENDGQPTLRISELFFNRNDWPIIHGP